MESPNQPVDHNDAYSPTQMSRVMPMLGAAEIDEIVRRQVRQDMADIEEWAGFNLDGWEAALTDAYSNRLTGIGDPGKDKTFGGRGVSGPEFVVQYMSSWEAMDRWRGSDLGARIIECIPNEMTRRGWSISVQPEEGEFDEHDPARVDSKGLSRMLRRVLIRMGLRRDEWPAIATADPPHTPEPLPHLSEDGTSIVQALEAQQRRLRLKDRIREALCFERAFGGGAILIGVDDGNAALTSPLDMERVRSIKHLTTFRGGWDGELVAWRYYNDPRSDKYGLPEIYMLRNIGVPIGGAPAPGESPAIIGKNIPNGTFASTMYFVHESRLLIFDGQPVSRWARTQMRGWSDTIFTRTDRVLSQYDQTWSGISILMQEYSLPVMSMEGLAKLIAEKGDKALQVVIARAKAQQLAMSIAQMRLIDSKEKLERMSVPLSGTAEVLQQFTLRLAAATGMPVSMLMGQVQSGLGDASKGDIVFFYDQIAGLQDDRVLPAVERMTRLQFLAKDTSPTGGKIPKRWGVEMNPLMQMNDEETAKYRKLIADTDKLYVDMGATTPEEVAGTRFGGSDFNDGPIVLDMEGRRLLAEAAKQKALSAPEVDPNADPNAPPSIGSTEPEKPGIEPPPAPTTDAADFITKNGRTKVRTSVSIVVPFNDKGQVLLGRKRESGKLVHPGGHAERNEDALSCAVRELWEETGLHPVRMQLLGTKTIGGSLAHVHITVFRAVVEGEPDASGDPDQEFDGFVWADVSSGDYTKEVKSQLHHERDVIGPMLRRRKRSP